MTGPIRDQDLLVGGEALTKKESVDGYGNYKIINPEALIWENHIVIGQPIGLTGFCQLTPIDVTRDLLFSCDHRELLETLQLVRMFQIYRIKE